MGMVCTVNAKRSWVVHDSPPGLVQTMTADANGGSGDLAGEAAQRKWLTPGVGAVAAASFFSDTGHEITTSVLPTFVTGTLGASAAALGVIDGVSDALIGVMKLVGGPLANDPAKRGRTALNGDVPPLVVIWAPP